MSAPDRAAVGIAGAAYVGAWVVGLLIAPSAPSPDASDAPVQAFFTKHHASTLIQAPLVRGVAGVALAVFVVSLARCLAVPGSDQAWRLFVFARSARPRSRLCRWVWRSR